MITTTHILYNTALLGRKEHPERNWPLVLGSILPDVPMIVYNTLMVLMPKGWDLSMGSSWNEYHYREFWVDWGHSIPLALAGFLLCFFLKKNWGLYFFAAMGLHDLEDLPVHAESAHRHFLPLSDWRFNSPISFVDPRYHAAWVAPLEWGLVIYCIHILWRRNLPLWIEILLLFVGVFQGLWLVYYFGFYRW
jgi:hypothetical protein